ncbi:MAG: NAD-dependent epimerase/dehydratase family protein [Alphaproteobacteria bacterium]|nr:NAD-dependent epimerase/dehydratase family protein [Alphaproteobacteria bacterium]
MSEVSTFAVIGASGYIGSKLVNKLTDSGCNVIRSSRRDTITNGDSEFVMAELDSLDFWLNIVKKSDVIIHLAGNTSINVANDNPALDLNSSVVPIYRLIEACKILRKRPRVVFASTVTAYGFTDNLPVSEATAENPESFYDLHKFFVERQLVLATKLNICDGVSLRLANVYGPSSANSSANDRGILNKIIGLALAGDIVSLYGGGNYIRDYIYIDDVVDAFILASISSKSAGEVFNIGSGNGTSVRDAFNAVTQEVYRQTNRIIEMKDVPWPENSPKIDMRNFTASIKKAHTCLGWSPKVSLQTGIATTVKSII